MEENEIKDLIETEATKVVERCKGELLSAAQRLQVALPLAALVESQIEKELTLIAARTGWMLTSQAIIFAFYGILITADPSRLNRFPKALPNLERRIPVIAIVLICITSSAVSAALSMLVQLHKVRANVIGFINKNTAVNELKLREIGNKRWQSVVGLLAPALISVVLLVAWIGVMYSFGWNQSPSRGTGEVSTTAPGTAITTTAPTSLPADQQR